MPSNLKTFPANLLKFDAYIKVTDSLDAAIKVIKDKRLAYGQPCVVTYKWTPPDSDVDPKSPDGTTKKVLFGIGSMDPKDPYILGIEYDKDGNPVNQEDLNRIMQEIIDEYEKSHFTVTAVKYSKTEEPNINDTDFSYGDIILGEGAIKQVRDNVLENSTDLVTSDGIYRFFTSLIAELEATVNSIQSTLVKVVKDVSTCKNELIKVKKDVSTLKGNVTIIKLGQEQLVEDVSTLNGFVTVLQADSSRHDASITTIYANLRRVIRDVSVIKNKDIVTLYAEQEQDASMINDLYVKLGKVEEDVSILKNREQFDGIISVNSESPMITVKNRMHVATITVSIDEGFNESFMEDASGRVALRWAAYENKY